MGQPAVKRARAGEAPAALGCLQGSMQLKLQPQLLNLSEPPGRFSQPPQQESVRAALQWLHEVTPGRLEAGAATGTRQGRAKAVRLPQLQGAVHRIGRSVRPTGRDGQDLLVGSELPAWQAGGCQPVAVDLRGWSCAWPRTLRRRVCRSAACKSGGSASSRGSSLRSSPCSADTK